MAEKTTTSFYLFSFSHYILNDVDTSNCKAMISMIKATCLFFSRKICEKFSNIKFHENPSSSSRTDGRTDGRADVSKIIVAFRNFAKAPSERLRVTIMLAFRCDISVKYEFRPWLHYLQCVREITVTVLT